MYKKRENEKKNTASKKKLKLLGEEVLKPTFFVTREGQPLGGYDRIKRLFRPPSEIISYCRGGGAKSIERGPGNLIRRHLPPFQYNYRLFVAWRPHISYIWALPAQKARRAVRIRKQGGTAGASVKVERRIALGRRVWLKGVAAVHRVPPPQSHKKRQRQ